MPAKPSSIYLLLCIITLAPLAAASDPPGSPEGLEGDVQPDGSLLLTWQPPAGGGAEGYRVYENGALLEEVSDLSHLIGQPAPVSVFTVTAFNQDGESMHSAPFLYGPVGDDPACFRLVPPWVEPEPCKQFVIGTAVWAIEELLGGPHPLVSHLAAHGQTLLASGDLPVDT